MSSSGISLTTNRLKIEPWQEAHAEAFLDLTRDQGFNAYPITIYRQTDIESARQWIRESIALRERTGLGKTGIWEKENSTLIGMGGLTPWEWEGEVLIDLTYRFRQSAWGKGYGSEVAFGLVEYGFNKLRLSEITATITPDNVASKKIVSRIGMKFDQRILLKGVETELFRLRREDFQPSAG